MCEILMASTTFAPTTSAVVSTAPTTRATKNRCANARNDNGADVMGVASPYRREPTIPVHPAHDPGAHGQPTSGSSDLGETGTERVSGVVAGVGVLDVLVPGRELA